MSLLSSRGTLKAEVDAGRLLWEAGEPAEVSADPSDLITRADFENWTENKDMSASSVALNQIMSVAAMQQWKATGLLNAPSSLSVNTITSRPDGETKISVTWVSSYPAANTVLNVYVGGSLLKSVQFGPGVEAGIVDGLSPSNTYVVFAYHEDSGMTSPSSSDSATTLSDGPNAGPSNLIATRHDRPEGETTILVNWANGDSTAQTRIHWRESGGLWQYQTVAAGVTSASIAVLSSPRASDTLFDFRVEHVKNGVYIGLTGIVNETTVTDGPDADPSGLSASQSGNTVSLNWNSGDTTASTQIYRSVNGGGYVFLKTVGSGVESTGDTINAGDTITYHARHIKNSVVSGYSNTDSVTATQPVGAPSNLIVTGANGQFNLSWTNADAYSSIRVYRSLNGSSHSLWQTLAPGTTAVVSSGHPENTRGSFYVRHAYDGFVSATSAIEEDWTYDPVDAAPSGLEATDDVGGFWARWTNGDFTCDSTIFHREEGAVTWIEGPTVGPGINEVTVNAPLRQGVNHEWKVRHSKVDNKGLSWSLDSAVDMFYHAYPTAPTPVVHTAQFVDGGGYYLAWNNPGAFYTYVKITRMADGHVYYDETIPSGTNSVTANANIGPSTTVWIEVRHDADFYEPSAPNAGDHTTPEGPNGVPYDNGTYYDEAVDDIVWTWADPVEDFATYVIGYQQNPDGVTLTEEEHAPSVQQDAEPAPLAGLFRYHARYRKNGYFSPWTSWTFRVGPEGIPFINSISDNSNCRVDKWGVPIEADYSIEVGITLAAGEQARIERSTDGVNFSFSATAVSSGSIFITGEPGTNYVRARSYKHGFESTSVSNTRSITLTDPCEGIGAQ